MYYSFQLAVTHGTAKASAVEQILKLTSGVIERVEVQFPAGTFNLVHIAIFLGGHQVWPTNPDGALQSDGYTIPIDDFYPLDADPFELVARGWSDADTYDYTVDIRIGLSRPEEIERQSPLMSALSRFLSLVGVKR